MQIIQVRTRVSVKAYMDLLREHTSLQECSFIESIITMEGY